MAKISMVAREDKRKRMSDRDFAKRSGLKSRIIDESLSDEERWDAMIMLQKMPRDGSRSRQRSRCVLTGRPRGYYRRFGLARNKLRELIMRGEVPGVVKSSW